MNKMVSKLFFVLLLLGTLVGFQGNTVDAKKDMPIDDLSITGKYAIIMDMDTDTVLYRRMQIQSVRMPVPPSCLQLS